MKRIIGVCACPAGIAHTYMAAENLERQGKKLGFQVKIETNGSGGDYVRKILRKQTTLSLRQIPVWKWSASEGKSFWRFL